MTSRVVIPLRCVYLRKYHKNIVTFKILCDRRLHLHSELSNLSLASTYTEYGGATVTLPLDGLYLLQIHV